ncbi:hypothetical protein GCM10022237_33860 [Nocardioides ginsengisoli]|uniref:Response regulator transcription factor n=1 Tax=Nocardioides ginsengisoli TaxID=363868 RepID=A0ABW3VVV0_9ACTN
MDHSWQDSLTVAVDVRATARCRLLAETLVRQTGAHAVGLMGISPEDGAHIAVLNVDYDPSTFEHHASRRYTRHTPGVQRILGNPGTIHSWEDIPDFRESYQAQAVYQPAGFHNGVSVALAGPDRRTVGMLHVSTRRDRMDPDTLNLVERSRPVLTEWVDTMTRFQLARLSSRQTEILCRVRDGMSNAEIAADLVIAPRTVTTHIEQILRRLGATNRTQAAVWAERYGLRSPGFRDG